MKRFIFILTFLFGCFCLHAETDFLSVKWDELFNATHKEVIELLGVPDTIDIAEDIFYDTYFSYDSYTQKHSKGVLSFYYKKPSIRIEFDSAGDCDTSTYTGYSSNINCNFVTSIQFLKIDENEHNFLYLPCGISTSDSYYKFRNQFRLKETISDKSYCFVDDLFNDDISKRNYPKNFLILDKEMEIYAYFKSPNKIGFIEFNLSHKIYIENRNKY